jgi:hypothetical protein
MIIFLSYASEQLDIAEEIKLALAAGETSAGRAMTAIRQNSY